MTDKVTLIGDKDVGPVLGAVSEVNASGKLKIAQVVAKSGFPMRADVTVSLEVPREELETYEITGSAPLLDPRSYVVVDQVPQVTSKTIAITPANVKGTELVMTLTPAPPATLTLKGKAITRRRSDGVIETFPVAALAPTGANFSYGITLRPGERYDILMLVQGHKAWFEEDKVAN